MQLVHGHPCWSVFAVQRPLSGRVKYCVGAMPLGTQPNTKEYPVQRPHGQLTALLYWCSGRTASWFVVFCWGMSAQPIDCSILLCMARRVCVCLVCSKCVYGCGCVLYMGLCVGMCSCVCFVYISFVHVQRATLHHHILGSLAGSFVLEFNRLGNTSPEVVGAIVATHPVHSCTAFAFWLCCGCGVQRQSVGVMGFMGFPTQELIPSCFQRLSGSSISAALSHLVTRGLSWPEWCVF
jgi:hypothetical protein